VAAVEVHGDVRHPGQAVHRGALEREARALLRGPEAAQAGQRVGSTITVAGPVSARATAST
jgi:hypothetical protein